MKKLFAIVIPFLLIGCVSINIEPESYGIKNLLEWAELQDDIFSWIGKNKTVLVKEWGIPNSSMNLGIDQEQFEYYLSDTLQTTVGNEQTVSTYYEYSNKTYSDTVKKETTTTSKTESKIRLFIVKNVIEEISYSGTYSQLKKICKSRGDNSYFIQPYIYTKVWRQKKAYPTYEDFTTDELFRLLLPLSKNASDLNFSKSLLKTFEESHIKNHSKYNKQQKKNLLANSNNHLTSSNIESFLAEVMIYRKEFENEQFDPNPYFIDKETKKQMASQTVKYTLDDFNSRKLSWKNVSLEDIIALKIYSDTSVIEIWENEIDNTYFKKHFDGKSEKDYIDEIELGITKGLDENTVYPWIKIIEYYYETFPERYIVK